MLLMLAQGRHVSWTAAALLVLGACSSRAAPPPTVVEPPATAAATAEPSATPVPAPTATPTAIPSPTATFAPTVSPLPPAVIRGGATGQAVYAGSEAAFEVSSLKPLERAVIVYTSPDGAATRSAPLRADRAGKVSWKRDTFSDAAGQWTVQVEGDQGSQARLTYTLRDLELPTEQVTVGKSAFRVYRTPEASFFFTEQVRPAQVARMAELFRSALGTIPAAMQGSFTGPLDFFLFADAEGLKREVEAAGVDPGAGPLAGISVHGFERPRIYLDVRSPYAIPSHILGHEFSHQVTSRLDNNQAIPAWLDEGMAEYFGVRVASVAEPVKERTWRRLIRDEVRSAIKRGGWIDLSALTPREVWSKEADPERIDLMYGEGYASAEYVTRTFGEKALRALLDRLSGRPEDLAGAAKELFGVTPEEFQQRVQGYVLQADEGEQEAQRTVQAARTLFSGAEEESKLGARWTAYVRQRPLLSRQERLTQLQGLAASYRELQAQAQAAGGGEALREPRDVYAEGYGALALAMESFQRYEQGQQGALEEGNRGLGQGNGLLNAARDLLTQALVREEIRPEEVRGAAATGQSPVIGAR